MSECLFILGREPELSVAELACWARRVGVALTWREVTEHYALVEGQLSPQVLASLAGTIKIAEVVGKCARAPASVRQTVVAAMQAASDYPDYEFGFSSYGAKLPWLTSAGINAKRELKSTGKHIRFVVSKGNELSSVVVAKRKLLPPDGFEFIVVPQGAHKLLVARTIEVQDFEAWSSRDYGRPARDARVGMLPPKLARMMVNLAEAPPDGALLDPFCGSGTVLQEAALAGYTNLVGADADARGIERTKQNFTWLTEKFINTENPKSVRPDTFRVHLTQPELLAVDIRDLPRTLDGKSFNAIVTEPYLGPPLRGNEPSGKLRQMASELTDLYQTLLRILAHLVVRGGRIVMVWPVVKAGNTDLPLPLMELLPQVGLKIVNVLPEGVPHGWHTSRGTLRYERPDARVGREIVVLERK